MKIFDTHCHLAGEELRPRAVELMGRAVQEGVMGAAIISADEFSLKAAPNVCRELRQKFPEAKIVWTAGIHPHDSEKAQLPTLEFLESQFGLADAIGETGLDFYYDHSERTVQQTLFQRHIEAAASLKKPLVIHCRQAAPEILKTLDQAAIKGHPNPGILHCFAEDKEFARKVLDWGFYISFSGILTFKNAQALREVAQFVPVDRLLIETDSPWLAPIPHRGKRNEPAWTKCVWEVMAQIRPESRDDLGKALWSNSLRVFGLSESVEPDRIMS